MKLITTTKFAAMLASHKGSMFVKLVTATEPKMNQKHRETKAPNPFLGKRVLRMAERHGIVGASYENAVDNQRVREGHGVVFKAESLWNGAGEHVEGSQALVRHRGTGKLYLVFYPHREDSVMQDAWSVDGEEVASDILKPYLAPSTGSKRQETEREIQWRTIALENVAQIQMNGEIYVIAD